MKDEKQKLLHYVDDIGIGVLISSAKADCPVRKILPKEPTVTFICRHICDATKIANYIVTKQKGEPITDGDLVIEVGSAFGSYGRFLDEYKFEIE